MKTFEQWYSKVILPTQLRTERESMEIAYYAGARERQAENIELKGQILDYEMSFNQCGHQSDYDQLQAENERLEASNEQLENETLRLKIFEETVDRVIKNNFDSLDELKEFLSVYQINPNRERSAG